MHRQSIARTFLGLAWFSMTTCSVHVARAETLVQRNVDSRVTLMFRVSPSAVQAWLPAPWQLEPIAKGPSTDANLSVTFIDRLVAEDEQGKVSGHGIDRMVGLTVPAKNPNTGEVAPMVIRLYTSSPDYVPGPYKNSVLVKVSRETATKGSELEAGTGMEKWKVEDSDGGVLSFHVQYQRNLPTRGKSEVRPHSAVDPSFYRIYRYDEGSDVVKSTSNGIDRAWDYEFRSTIQELRGIFDGSEQLKSITIRPWYVREVFLP